MVKIKSGVYGFKEKNGSITPKTSKDAAFSLSAKDERRLVDRGVAVFVNEKPSAHTPLQAPSSEKPEYTVETNANELKALLVAAGLPIKTAMKKELMVAMLDEYYNVNTSDDTSDIDDNNSDDDDDDDDGDGDNADDDEKLPDMGAEDPLP